jgi:hypothetical protein
MKLKYIFNPILDLYMKKILFKPLKIVIISIVIILIFPTYIFINRVSKDYPLREYVKEKFITQLMHDMSLYSSAPPPTKNDIPSIYIELSDSAITNLSEQRDHRISMLLNGKSNLMGSGQWAYVSGKAIYENDTFNIEIRLRGDMPSNYNRSLTESTMRFNIKKGKALAGKKKLSLIRPALESGYYGYLFYKCFNDFGFLANDIDFVKLYFNDEYAGIRFLQEGFSKELLESSNRRAGPIVRFKNDCVDEQNRYNPNGYPEMVAYGEKKILNDTILSATYARALNKYNELITGNIEVTACFNVQEYGRFYALSDIFLSHHSNKCQNIKLYFNPIDDKFEPIAWDPNNFDRYEVHLDIQKGHTQRFGEICNDMITYPLHHILSKNTTFLNAYSAHLKTYSQDSLILKKIGKYAEVISSTEGDLFRQNFQERFDVNKIVSNLSKIHQDFNQEQLLYGNYFIKKQTLSIRSLSNLPIIIDSVCYKNKTQELNWVIAPNDEVEKIVYFDSISIAQKKLKIYSRILGTAPTRKYKAKVFSQKDLVSSPVFREEFDSSYFNFNEIEKSFVLKTKKIQLNKDLYIPDLGMTWIIEPGTIIELNHANIICESNVKANGLTEKKIYFSGKNSGGILLKNNSTESSFSNTVFSSLAAPTQGNWSLTGAVNFYNTQVKLQSCSFNNMQSEDALNLVNCTFQLEDIYINNSYSDALDIDFGKGTITNITIDSAKNDGLDFSGSTIQLESVTLRNIGDKAISSGEKSIITCSNVIIFNSFIGVASKDASFIKVNLLNLVNTKIDFTAYQKKAQYDMAKIEIINSGLNSPKTYIEKGSLLIIDEKKISGDKLEVYNNLYPK